MTFDIALTGLNAASAELEVISNNIANNATTGFKRSRAEFADVYSESTFGYSNVAVGQGVQVSTMQQEFEQGDISFTNNNLDLSISGGGLFRMNDNGNTYYTRAGSFGLDPEGYIVNGQGGRLTGFTTDSADNLLPITQDLQIDYSDLAPKASENIEMNLNLDVNAEVLPPFDVMDPSTSNYVTSTTVYDSLGSPQIATMYFHKDTPSSWSTYTFVDGVEVSQPGGDEVTFNSTGTVQSINGGATDSLSTSVFNPTSGASPMAVEFKLGEITQFDNPFGVNQISQDGYATGRLTDFSVDSEGVIFGRFSNGQAKIMGQITLSNFPNMQGLQQIGNSSWKEAFASGQPATGVAGSASLGVIQSGALEGSNVDITKELVSMIGAQRSFQANAQVISTGDTLTQTVINIRR